MKFGIIVLSLLIVFLSGCQSEDTLVIYTDRHYDSDQQIFEAFERESGLDISVFSASADEIIARLISEGENTPADIIWLTDVGRLERANDKALFQPISEEVTDIIPSKYVEAERNYVGVTKRARVFVYHPERVSEEELSTYEALVDGSFDGRIVTRSSRNVYNQSLFASLYHLLGEDAFTTWVTKLNDQLSRTPVGNDRDQAKAVYAGEADIAIMNTYYMGKMYVSSDPLEQNVARTLDVFFPNQETSGTHINMSGMGISQYTTQTEDAEAFLAFILSVEVQNIIASTNFEYPVNEEADIHPFIEAWGSFNEQSFNLSLLGDYYQDISLITDEIGFE